MYKILIALLITTPCHATDLFYSNNEAGGRIVLTDKECINKSLLAYTTRKDGHTTFGCYTMNKSYIFVQWQTGKNDVYSLANWQKVEYF